jgi:hypothetical protein
MLTENLAGLIRKALVRGHRRHVAALVQDQFSGPVSFPRALQQIMSCRARRRSRDDLNANADRQTEIAVPTSLIDGDFGKPIRILVPQE